jgi:hypothetical protein
MRRKIERFIGLSIMALAIIFAALYLFLAIMGQTLLTKELQDLTRRKVTMDYFSITPSFTVELKNLDIQGLAKSKSVIFSPSLTGLLRGKIIIGKLIFTEPEFFFNKKPPEITEVKTATVVIVPTEASVPSKTAKANYMPFGVAYLNIKNGKLIFIDQTVSSGSLKITVQEINSTVSNLYLYPSSAITKFQLMATIPWRDNEAQGKIELSGWIDSFKRDMQASLKITDIDAVYLYPYYSYWVDLDKARIERAKLNLSSEITGLNNNVTANCHLELADMVRKPLEIGESEEKASKITNAVIDRFKNMDQGRVELNFAVKTKMDSPQFSFDNFKMAFEDKITRGRSPSRFKLQDTLIFPVKVVEGGVKSFTDLSRAMIDGVFAIGNEIGKMGTDALKKDPSFENK